MALEVSPQDGMLCFWSCGPAIITELSSDITFSENALQNTPAKQHPLSHSPLTALSLSS